MKPKPGTEFNFGLKFTPDQPSISEQCDSFSLKYDRSRIVHFETIRKEIFHLLNCGIINDQVANYAVHVLFEQICKHVLHANNIKLKQDENAPNDAPVLRVLPESTESTDQTETL